MHPNTEKEFEKIVLEKEEEAINEAIMDHRKSLQRSQITHIGVDEGQSILKELHFSKEEVLARGITEQDFINAGITEQDIIDSGLTEQELIARSNNLIPEEDNYNLRSRRDVDSNNVDNPFYPIPVISRQDLSSLFNQRLFFVIPHEENFSYDQRKKVKIEILVNYL